MARRKRKPQGPSLDFEKVPLPSSALPSEASMETRDNSEALGDDNMPDIVRSGKDLKAIAARGDQLRRLGKALPLCWLPGDPTTFKDTNG